MKNTQNVLDNKDLQRKIRERVNNSYQINRTNPLPFLENKRKGIDSYINERKLKKINLQKEKKQSNQLDKSLSKTTQKDICINNLQRITQPKQQDKKKYEDIYRHIVDIYNNSNSNDQKKRVIMSPNKIFPHQKLFYGLEPLRKEIQKMRIQNYLATNNEMYTQSKISPFSSAIKQLGIYNQYDSKNKNKMMPFKSTQNTASMYRSSSRKNRQQKLKPLSQTNIKRDPTDFLSVQRIYLFQGEARGMQQGYTSKPQTILDQKITQQDSYSKQDESLKQIKNKTQLSAKVQTIFRSKAAIQQNFKFVSKNNVKERVNGKKYNVVVLSDNQRSKLKLANSSQLIRITSQLQEKHQFIQQQQQDTPNQQKKDQITLIEQELPKECFQPKLRKKKFQIPFQTYYYRDLIWKMNFSNQLFIETPAQYQHRLKVFIGRGNNSSMVGGLIKRRIWFATTDRIQQANFVWTQLKSLPYFKKQDKKQGQQLVQNKQLKYIEKSILTDKDKKIISSYMETYINFQQRGDQKFTNRQKVIKYQKIIKIADIKQTKIQNHLINNYVIGNKKALFQTMTNYYNSIGQDVFNYLPLTFHIKNGLEDQSYFQFLKYFYKRAKQIKANTSVPQKKKDHNAWIVKPGENSNRGQGIQVCLNLEQIKQILKKKGKYSDGSPKTYIVQSYIQKPLLYQRRKFDLRHYLMITCINGMIKGYWYKDGYVRTTSTQYNLKTNCGKIHLTNDAVQKNLPDYGKYQKGNKISYQDLHNYMQTKYKDFDFFQKIYPKMKKVATDIVRACSASIDPEKLTNNFQIYGLDFMIDSNFNVWLIQVNSNPCLQLSCPLLGCIIPKMIENALQLTLDCMFPPPVRYTPKGMHYYKNLQKQNRFQLVYDERIQGLSKCSMDVLDPKMLYEEDDTFEDDGEQWNQD